MFEVEKGGQRGDGKGDGKVRGANEGKFVKISEKCCVTLEFVRNRMQITDRKGENYIFQETTMKLTTKTFV